MVNKTYETSCGTIQYWTSEHIRNNEISLIFLPGLTADHRLFEKQIAHFADQYNVFVWDAPDIVNGLVERIIGEVEEANKNES